LLTLEHGKPAMLLKAIVIVELIFSICTALCRQGVAQSSGGPISADPEQTAARVFEAVAKQDWRQMERLVRPNLQRLCTADTFQDPNKAEWGMGFQDFDRITFADETQLAKKFHDLVLDWKAGRTRRRPVFYNTSVHRFAIEECGKEEGGTKIVIAVYLSRWYAWKESVALMLGK
jgi:hypothetical protein